MTATTTIEGALTVFQKHWGFAKFRRYQEAVIEPALANEDVIAVLPTGSGKSACFQVPALCRDGGAIVISPLIALMKDQVDGCVQRGIPAGCIHSHMDDDDKREALDDFKAGALKLLYVSPERLNVRSFIDAIQACDVSYIVADEAHCCSEWGHQFRPDYMRINRLVRALTGRGGKRPPIMAVTATATELVIGDIKTSIGMDEDARIVIADPVRHNLEYVTENGAEWRTLEEWIAALNVKQDDERRHHIIYANTRRAAEQCAEIAERVFWPGVAAAYHAGLRGDKRTEVQDSFVRGDTPIIAATTAFGMGIDVATIRTVINFGIPGSIEAFVQQTGRAGRDGKLSRVVLINSDWAVSFQQTLVENENPPVPLYGMLWEWLHNEIGSPAGKLRTTHRSISQDITAQRRGAVNPEQVGVILNVFHSVGLIERRVADGGTPIEVDAEKFRRLIEGLDGDKAKPPIKRLWHALWRMAVSPSLAQGERDMIVNKEAIRRECRTTAYMVGKALEQLEKRGVVTHLGDAFQGTEIRMIPDLWRTDLNDRLPVARIEERRRTDFRRLNAMIEYARLRTEAERKKAVRDYFLTPEDAVG